MRVRRGLISGTHMDSSGTGTEADPYKLKVDVSSEGGDPIDVNIESVALGTEIDVNLQDQTTPTLILPAIQQLGADALDGVATVDSYTVDVVDSTGMTVGDHFRIINSAGNYYYWGTILGIATNTITLDNPIDYAYLSGSEVTWGNINMAVNGSVTPVHFHLRTGSPSIPAPVDITRIIMSMATTDIPDFTEFGDIAGGLTRGLLMRIINGTMRNVLNVKTNADLAALAYDLAVYEADKKGINGIGWRLTFGSSGKMGVVLRVTENGQIEFVVQDDLSSLLNMNIYFEGHVTTGEEA